MSNKAAAQAVEADMPAQAEAGTRDFEPFRPFHGVALPAEQDLAARSIRRDLAEETPISIVYNGLAYAVMMATPADLEDFAAGFSLTQGVVAAYDEIAEIDMRALPEGVVVNIRIAPERFAALATGRRNLVGQTGCGLCGVVELSRALLPLRPIETPPAITRAGIFRAIAAARGLQGLNHATGAMHAAAFCDPDGAPRLLFEDVGRHNALDKLIGAMMRRRIAPEAGFALATSRCSYELVEKAVYARIPALATISAPTALAIERARDARLTLVALARPDGAIVFNDPFGVFA